MANKKTIKAKIDGVFKRNSGIETLLVTQDGECFLPHFKNLAYDHARKTESEVITVSRNYKASELDKLVSETQDTEQKTQEGDEDQKGNDESEGGNTELAERAKQAVEQGLETGVITKSGTWLKFGEDGLAQGKDNTVQYLAENTEILEKIEKTLESPAQNTHKAE